MWACRLRRVLQKAKEIIDVETVGLKGYNQTNSLKIEKHANFFLFFCFECNQRYNLLSLLDTYEKIDDVLHEKLICKNESVYSACTLELARDGYLVLFVIDYNLNVVNRCYTLSIFVSDRRKDTNVF